MLYDTSSRKKNTKRKLRTSSASTVISISLVIFMLGILGLVLINAQRLSNYVKENIGFTVMLNEDVKERCFTVSKNIGCIRMGEVE